MAPLSGLAFYFCVRMMLRLLPQYHAARDKWRPPHETPEERDALAYSTKQELISAGFMVSKVVLLILLFLLVFGPWGDVLKDSWRALVVRIGLDLIIFLMLGHAITRSRYWDRLSQIIPPRPFMQQPDVWDGVTERRKANA